MRERERYSARVTGQLWFPDTQHLAHPPVEHICRFSRSTEARTTTTTEEALPSAIASSASAILPAPVPLRARFDLEPWPSSLRNSNNNKQTREVLHDRLSKLNYPQSACSQGFSGSLGPNGNSKRPLA